MQYVLFISFCFSISPVLFGIEYQIFFLAGQSNAVGVAEKEPLLNEVFPSYILNPPQGFVQVYHILNQQLGPLELGVNHNSNTNWISHGPEVGFLQYLYDHGQISSDRPALLFKYAYGGTSLAVDWSVDNPESLYYEFIHHYEKMLEILHLNGDTAIPNALLWIQGESDGGKKTKDYGDRLYRFIRRFRYDVLKNTNIKKSFPVITVRMKNNKAFDRQQNKVERRDSNFGIISSNNLSLSEDGVHYDTQGLWDMGLRLGEKYLQMINETNVEKLYLDLLPYPNPIKRTETLRIRTRQSLKCDYVFLELAEFMGRKIHSTQFEEIELNEIGLEFSLVDFPLTNSATTIYIVTARYQGCGNSKVSGVVSNKLIVKY